MRLITLLSSAAMFVCLSFEGADLALALCPAVPNQLTNGQPADASQVMADFAAIGNCVNNAPAGSTNALQFNAGSGSFGGVGPLTNGQALVGVTGAAPQAATLSAGSGIVITNGAGSIAISATGGGGGSSWPLFVPPHAADFPVDLNDGTPLTLVDDPDVGLIYYTSGQPTGDRIRFKGKTVAAGTNFTVVAKEKFTVRPNDYENVGLTIWSAGQTNAVIFARRANGNLIVARYKQSGTGYTDTPYQPSPTYSQYQDWLMIQYTAGSDALVFSSSGDGKLWLPLYSTTGTTLLGAAPTHIGIGVSPNIASYLSGASISYWNQN